jgi:urease accessory protein UreE
MTKAEREVRELLALYRKKGSKAHRSQMIDLAVRAVLDMCAHSAADSVYQIGNQHVRHYFKALRLSGRSDKTCMTHFYALNALWSAMKRPPPPRPWLGTHSISSTPA